MLEKPLSSNYSTMHSLVRIVYTTGVAGGELRVIVKNVG